MPKTVIEERIEFTFGDEWDVEQYDDHPDTRGFTGRIDERKAVDFVGCIGDDAAYLIEVKDYRGFRIENKPKFDGPLQRQVAAKVFDTLGGLVLANRLAPDTRAWRVVLANLRKGTGTARVVLYLEDDALFSMTGKNRRSAASVFTQELKRAMRWFPGHVLVVNRDYNQSALPGVTVRDLPPR